MPEMSDKARQIADRYEEAYYRAHGKQIYVLFTGSGWYALGTQPDAYSTAGHRRFRLAELEEMTARVEAMARDNEAAAARKGFVVALKPPRGEDNLLDRYWAGGDNWVSHGSPSVHVFDDPATASTVANKINEPFPFKYAVVESF